MAKQAQFVVTGLAELDAALHQMSNAVHNKVVRKAVRQAAKPVLKEARRLVPVKTGALRKSLKIKSAKRSRKRTSIGVEVVTGKQFFTGDTYYGGMIEFGTKYIKPRSFLRDAAKAKENEAVSVFRQELRDGIEREAAKLRVSG